MASIYRRKKNGPYYITYVIRHGVRKTVRGCKDKAATEALARKFESDAMLRREGIIDARADQYAKAEARPLVVKDADDKIIDGHLADFYASLVARGTTSEHATLVRARAAKIIDLSKAERLGALAPSAVQAAIASLRDGDDDLSLQTCNHYLRAIKQFSRWLWRDGRAREDVLAHLTGFNVALDRRHDRRALTDEELARLIGAAESGPTVMGMTGSDRAMLYQVAVGTGFRANELRSLTPESFDLDADPPVVTIEAAYSKHRRKDVQPIRRDLADLLRPWLEAKQPDGPVFNSMPDKTAKMMKKDLAKARKTWVEEVRSPEAQKEREGSYYLAYRDAAGLVADFHALRHTYVSRLVRSGANVKVAQELARHSTPMLTLGRYAHMEILDHTRALDALPSIEHRPAERETARATGTDDATASAHDAPGQPSARSAIAARRCPEARTAALTWQGGNLDSAGAKAVESLRVVATGHDLSRPNKISGRRSSTAEHRFCKPVVGGPNPPAGSMNGSYKLQVSSFKLEEEARESPAGACGGAVNLKPAT